MADPRSIFRHYDRGNGNTWCGREIDGDSPTGNSVPSERVIQAGSDHPKLCSRCAKSYDRRVYDGGRKCCSCETFRPLSEFYPDETHSGSHSPRCRACLVVPRKIRREEDLPLVQSRETESQRKYRRNPERRAAMNAAGKRHAAKYPRKTRARALALEAIRSGKLVRQPCEACGAAPAEAHHDDYLSPLSVRWLCHLHHAEWHRLNGPGANGEGTDLTDEQRAEIGARP